MNYSKFGDGVLVIVFMFSLCDFFSPNAVFQHCAGSVDIWVLSSYAIILMQNIAVRTETEVSHRLMILHACSSTIMIMLLVSAMANAIFGSVAIWKTLQETPHCLPSIYTQHFLIAWNLLCYAWAIIFGCMTVLHLANRWDIVLGFDVRDWHLMDFVGSPVTKCTQKDLSVLPKVSLTNYLVHRLKDKECTICLSDFRHKEEVRLNLCQTCLSSFHTACIDEWLVCEACCPNCKTIIAIPTFSTVEQPKPRLSSV